MQLSTLYTSAAAALVAALAFSPCSGVVARPSADHVRGGMLPQAVFSAYGQSSGHTGSEDGSRHDDDALAPTAASQKRVNVTLGVMSKCPDALACEAVFDKVLERVNTKTHLHMSYIGAANASATYGVDCKHGDTECLANIQQLCVQDALNPQRAGDEYDLSPSAAQRKWWNFLQCQNYAGLARIGSEALARQCLRLIDGPDWKRDGIQDCIEGKKGRRLLRESVERSKQRSITTSCTILIEGKARCIRDGAQWKQCDIGHEVGDFVTRIEREWEKKNKDTPDRLEALRFDDAAATISGTAATTTVQIDGNRLLRRQAPAPSDSAQPSDPPPSTSPTSGGGGGLFDSSGGGGTPPTVFTFIIAIALFVLVVGFVLLRIIVRNRRLRRLGLLPDGPIDRIIGPGRELEDTLVPPKLWEAKIAHNYLPEKTNSDLDYKGKGWDAVMPVSAALPPSVYCDLFPGDVTHKKKNKTNNGSSNNSNGGNGGAQASYPPPAGGRGGVLSFHMHMPAFLRRGEQGQGGEEPVAQSESFDGAGGDDSEKAATNNDTVPASVNVTVLIAMPSPRTVFPSAQPQLGRKASFVGGIAPPTIRKQPSTSLPPLTQVQSTRLDEVHEDENDGDDDDANAHSRLRRAGSVRSLRTTGSNKSVAEARREAFFGAMNDDGAAAAAAATKQADDAVAYDDDDEEELPELVFGTASVPIFCRTDGASTLSTTNPSAPANAPAVRKPFSDRSDTYHPIRHELLQIVKAAHEARDRKARNDVAAKDAEGHKESVDAQSAMDARGGSGSHDMGGAGRAAEQSLDYRYSVSETIDSDVGIQMSTMDSTRRDGLGDVVGRMMVQNGQPPANASGDGSGSNEPTNRNSSISIGSFGGLGPVAMPSPMLGDVGGEGRPSMSYRPSISSTLDHQSPRTERPMASTTTLDHLLAIATPRESTGDWGNEDGRR